MSDRSPTTKMPAPRDSAAGEAEAVRILVVEDFDALRSLLIRVLKLEGFQVVGVDTVSRAVALCTSEHFDLLITDHSLPGGNGTQIARRAFAHNPRLRILFISGDSESSLDLRVPGTVAEFLQKPFEIDVLTLRVRQLLSAPSN